MPATQFYFASLLDRQTIAAAFGWESGMLAPLPTEVESCHALIRQVNETNETHASQLEIAKFELDQLKRYIDGRRSERPVADDSQLTLFDGPQRAI